MIKYRLHIGIILSFSLLICVIVLTIDAFDDFAYRNTILITLLILNIAIGVMGYYLEKLRKNDTNKLK
jgi:uncharacterized protein (UPF0333 family)